MDISTDRTADCLHTEYMNMMLWETSFGKKPIIRMMS